MTPDDFALDTSAAEDAASALADLADDAADAPSRGR